MRESQPNKASFDTHIVLEVASEAGRVLLENGAEISRVEETMERIASSYGVDNKDFFVLSNGIITTGDGYAKAQFIPIKGTQLSRVAEVNQLSRDVSMGKYTPDALKKSLDAVRYSPAKGVIEQSLGIAFGTSSFSIIFGGSLLDAVATFAVGILLGLYMALATPHMSRIFSNLLGGLLGGGLCIVASVLGLGQHLPNMIIGTIIALVPGVPFTNGIRDLANGDYIAGITRLADAFLVFLCIAIGVALGFIVEGRVSGGIMNLEQPAVDAFCSQWFVQVTAAFLGTVGFSVLFGAPSKHYIACGLTGAIGWVVYLLSTRCLHLSLAESAFFSAFIIAAVSALFAVWRRCPATIFLVCGIIPLVPGGGIFWASYYLVANQLRQAAVMGYMSLKITIAIALGIMAVGIIGSRIVQRNRTKR
ncbi:MAG: threonine/serine exporter family protein [Bacteroidales bacterium]|nr:threonine/serine exporter family protein [Bacteroidales bacterium]